MKFLEGLKYYLKMFFKHSYDECFSEIIVKTEGWFSFAYAQESGVPFFFTEDINLY